METSDPQKIAAVVAQCFEVFQCQPCAEKIRDAVIAAKHRGKLLTLKCRKRDFMVCLSYDGGKRTITQNSVHIAVRVGDLVFDNLHPDGLPFDNWLSDFDGFGGVFVESETEF